MATLYLIVGCTDCWDCDASLLVPAFGVTGWRDEAALALGDADDPHNLLLLKYVDDLPESALAVAKKIQPRYDLHYSHTVEAEYFLTRCPCGAPQGDHYLHKPGDGPFFPLGDADARDVYLLELEPFGDDAFWGEPAGGVGAKILRHGTHCASIEELWIASRLLTRTKR